MRLADVIEQRLQTLEPSVLKIVDDSALHAGHQGNGGGGHFTLYITSSHFPEILDNAASPYLSSTW